MDQESRSSSVEGSSDGPLVTLLLTRSPFRASSIRGSAFAIATLAGALTARSIFGDPAQVPFVLLYPAVVLTALIAGTFPALGLAIGGGAWTLWRGGASSAAVVVFLLFSALLIYLIDALAKTALRLTHEKGVTQALMEEQRTLFAELQHRVANNLTFLGSLLRLSRKQVQENPAHAAEAYDDAIRRLEVIGRLHRRLHSPEALEQPLPQYLRSLCTDVLDATGAKNIVCIVDADDVRLSLSKLTSLSLLLVELMTNSLKHAFAGRETGTIEVDLKSLPGGSLKLAVTDDGPGIPSSYDAAEHTGLGTRIVAGLAKQLGGDLRLPHHGTAKTELVFSAR